MPYRKIVCFGLLILGGCGTRVQIGEQRSISFNRPVTSYFGFSMLKDGVVVEKRYLSIGWNMKRDDKSSARQSLIACIRELRMEGERVVAERCGLQDLSMEYATILIYRDEKDGPGSYELGAVIPVEAIFSRKPIDDVLSSGTLSQSPVKLRDGLWDFSWKEDQVAKKLGGVRTADTEPSPNNE